MIQILGLTDDLKTEVWALFELFTVRTAGYHTPKELKRRVQMSASCGI
jgi:hypothetical protein